MSAPPRLLSLDLVRGLVMVLMALDHADAAFNAEHVVTDSMAMHTPGSELPAAGFLTRWLTHLCAPTFLFLAGTSLALGLSRGLTRRSMLVRGLIVLALEFMVITPAWWPAAGRMIVVQVLYAIGLSMVLMAGLSRLPTVVLLVAALGWLAGGEWLTLQHWTGTFGGNPPWVALSLGVQYWPPGAHPALQTLGLPMVVVYPLLPWLAIMLLGWCFGRLLVARRAQGRGASGVLLGGGVLALAVFLVVRGLNGYGNMGLLRDGPGLLQWLHVSKYPPSLSFAALELGLMAVLLGLLMRREERGAVLAGEPHPLVVFGRTAMGFYVLHILLLATLGGLSPWAHTEGSLGLLLTWTVTPLALALLYPLCRAWGRFKRSRPAGSPIRLF